MNTSILLPPQILNVDEDKLIADATATFESLTGKQLQPLQLEAILIRVFAYYGKQHGDQMDAGVANMFIDFSSAPWLDYLVALVGVTRLGATGATTSIEFEIVNGHTGVIIPAGTRVQSTDGKAVFATISEYSVPIGTYTVQVDSECTTEGLIGNGYLAGSINSILDPQPFLVSASNTETTAGGSDQESDDLLRERAKLAPDAFSTAGTSDAYKFHTLSAHPSIIDVSVVGPQDSMSVPPGTVYIYPLVEGGGTTPTPIIDRVADYLGEPKRKVLCDTVIVTSPNNVDSDIDVELVLYNSAIDSEVLSAVQAILATYKSELKAKIGVDIVLSEIVRRCKEVDGVYDVIVTDPVANVDVDLTEYANIGAINVTITDHTDG